jgi:hypothetical protein
MEDALGEAEAIGDGELAGRLASMAREERKALAAFLSLLAAFDRRRLFAREGFPSLYAYCTEALGFSGAEASWRMHTARAMRRFPAIGRMLENGETHMGAVVQLGPLMNEDNHLDLLARARGKSKRELDFLMLSLLAPPPPAPAGGEVPQAQKIESPASDPSLAMSMPGLRDRIEPLSADWVRLSFMAGAGFLSLLDKGREALRRAHPSGRMEEVLAEGLRTLLEKKGDPAVSEPPAGAREPWRGGENKRSIPRWVKDEVWKRDGGCCAFVAENGRRCGERLGLEFDHIVPWALGGPSNDPRNVRLLCRSHNRHLGRKAFGDG